MSKHDPLLLPGLYMEALRYQVAKRPAESQRKLNRHHYVIVVCIVSKAGAALALAAGAVLTSIAFFVLLR